MTKYSTVHTSFVCTVWLTLVATLLPVEVLARVSLSDLPSDSLGMHASYLAEEEELTLDQAVDAARQGRFVPAHTAVLTFGIGAKPRWVRLVVDDPEAQPRDLDLVVDISWLDHISAYFISPSGARSGHVVGDAMPFAEREVPSRVFVMPHAFAPGATEIYLRVDTPDPMVIPVQLAVPQARDKTETLTNYSYGIIYGYLLGLLAYNTMLYFGLRQARYLLYSIYLTAFVLMNVGYTGHGYAWLWPEHVSWQRWGIPILIVLYSVTGLMFATSFLQTRTKFPIAHKIVWVLIATFIVAMAVTVGLQMQGTAVVVSFASTCLFALTMLWLGVMATASGDVAARYFLLAAITAIVGTVLSTLSTWGVIPFQVWSFRAVEFGLLTDATLLALALAHQLRTTQRARQQADELARRDLLTGLTNRRGFFEITGPIWDEAVRNDLTAAVILLDLDHFKQLNDEHGHAVGDAALVQTAKAIQGAARANDIVVRWGGEEFAVFLPGADVDTAVEMAERMRIAIGAIHVSGEKGEVGLSVSCGVASRSNHQNFDALMVEADQHMFSAKRAGRNLVAYSTYQGNVRARTVGNGGFAPASS